MCTSFVVCGAEIFLNISVSTALDPGGRELLANTVGWCGWEMEGRILSDKHSMGGNTSFTRIELYLVVLQTGGHRSGCFTSSLSVGRRCSTLLPSSSCRFFRALLNTESLLCEGFTNVLRDTRLLHILDQSEMIHHL